MSRRISLPVVLSVVFVCVTAFVGFTLSTSLFGEDPGPTPASGGDLRAGSERIVKRGLDTGSTKSSDDGSSDDGSSDDGSSDSGSSGEVCLCHIPPGNPGNAHTVCVGESAVCAHLAHGDSLGRCTDSCGGQDGNDCDRGQFCQRPEGECEDDVEGECVDTPEVCPSIFAPVCGCDERTYSNACYAAVGGVTVAFDGPCVELQQCGGSFGDTCEQDQFCRTRVGQCEDDDEGVCRNIPMICTEEFAPVCGCDEMTYANACLAHAAGVNVASEGECDVEGQVCVGSGGDTCDEGQFCRRPLGECGVGEGVCADMTEFCPGVLQPVCGCDGKDYDHPCLAAGEGVNVASKGECGSTCGGDAGDTCKLGQFCKSRPGDCSDDAEGMCTETPDDCPVFVEPVCGCDTKTYDNKCFADAAGVTIAYDGRCKTPMKKPMLERSRR